MVVWMDWTQWMSICGKFEYHSFLEKNNEIKDNKILIEKFVYENKRLFFLMIKLKILIQKLI